MVESGERYGAMESRGEEKRDGIQEPRNGVVKDLSIHHKKRMKRTYNIIVILGMFEPWRSFRDRPR